MFSSKVVINIQQFVQILLSLEQITILKMNHEVRETNPIMVKE